MATVFTDKKQKNSKGVWYAPGKEIVDRTKCYKNDTDFQIWVLRGNYAGHVKGGIAYTWRLVKGNLSLEECKKLLAKKLK